MARYIERAVAMDKIALKANKERMVKLSDVRDALNNAPTADVAPVVRCGECIYNEDCTHSIEIITRDYVLEKMYINTTLLTTVPTAQKWIWKGEDMKPFIKCKGCGFGIDENMPCYCENPWENCYKVWKDKDDIPRQLHKEPCEHCDYYAKNREVLMPCGNGMYETRVYNNCPMCGRELEG